MTPLLASVFKRIVKSGHLILAAHNGKQTSFGDQTVAPLTLRLHDRLVAFDLVRNPQLELGEAYMDGRISFEGGSIADFLDLIARNIGTGFGGGHLEWIAKFRGAARRLMPRNTQERARRNVAHHYDLSGGLYDLFLDTDKQYSCAYFQSPQDSLETAQLNKKRHIAAKLALEPSHKVLDIGSGWGGLGLHIAQTTGADVTGITLSQEQLKVANERAVGAGLSGRVRFRLEDYRHTQGTFDRIVSVGMFEHVGVEHYPAYFKQVSSLLKDDGVALIHSIGRSDGAGVTNPWISKYIFPGGYTPALSEVLPAVERSGLAVTDIEILRLHYAYTLAEWRRRFLANWERAKDIYDERFCRMWEFYLASAEMGFRHQGLVVFQLQLAKRVDALPIVRDYMMSVPEAPSRGEQTNVETKDRNKAAA
jgi:cyclopropane-fatty-acyl-phospholipid synthase